MPRKLLLLALIALMSVAVGSAADGDSQKLYAAIRTNDLSRLAALLDQGVDANAKDVADTRIISPLSNAAAIGSLEAMKTLVAHKANVNAQDGAGSTALIWGVRDIAKVRFLLEHGADPNLKTRRGQTALMDAATSPDHSLDIVRALLEKGADVKALNADGHTSLHEAAGAGNTQVVALLLEKGLDINAKTTEPTGGFTPLILAAQNGNTELIRLLIAKGADVNVATPRDNPSRVKNGPIDVGAITALGVASTFGPSSVVKALLDAGANVNAQDIRGMTPLMLAISTDDQNPEVIKLLLSRGASKTIRSREGDTVLDLARKTGAATGIELLGGTVSKPASLPPSVQLPTLKTAIERSTKLLEKTASSGFLTTGGCFACHAQPATQFGASAANKKGFAIDKTDAEKRQQMLSGVLDGGAFNGAGGEAVLYALEAIQRTTRVPEKTGDFLTAALLARQREDGRWRGSLLSRTPMQDGDITLTALCMRALASLSPPAMNTSVERSIERSRTWLMKTEPITIEHRAMRMLGLAAAKSRLADVDKAARSILERQRPDGGWAQRDELASDAYATGIALWALADAGQLKPPDAAFQRAVKFLLSTQAEDGSWHVVSRAVVLVQPYFESGFPYSHDQWISSMATGWATAALALAVEPAH